MTSEMLVTAFSLAIAAYALVSPERRLDLRIRLGLADWTVIVLGVLGVHYLFFAPALRKVGLVPNVDASNWGLTRDSLAYLVLALTTVFALVRIATARLRRRGAGSFQRLTSRLLHARKYPELAYLLERHLPQLVRIQENRYLAPRLRKALAPGPSLPLMLGLTAERKPRPWHRAGSALARVLPEYEGTQTTAELALNQILLSDHFVVDLARSHPYLGLEVLETSLPQVEEFQTKWLKALLDDRDSILYFEIKQNQWLASSGRYQYPATNRLLHHYFADVHTAERLGVWKPLGDYMIDRLDLRFREGPADDRLNQDLGDFADDGRWRNSECAVLSLFEYMVSEALFQNIPWHMWLYYLPHFADSIERNLQPGPGVDVNGEWPTPYHYLLYCMVSMLRDWIEATRWVPAGQENIVLESTVFSHENDNIPKSAILAFSEVIGTILKSEKLCSRFQAYILEISLGVVEDLRGHDLDEYARLMIEAIARGSMSQVSREYREKLQSLLPHCDLFRLRSVADDVLERADELTARS